MYKDMIDLHCEAKYANLCQFSFSKDAFFPVQLINASF